MIALAREDDAILRRAGDLGSLIFHHSLVATTPLSVARAGAAVACEAFEKYCHEKSLNPEETLRRMGTDPVNTRDFLDYGRTVNAKLKELQGKE